MELLGDVESVELILQKVSAQGGKKSTAAARLPTVCRPHWYAYHEVNQLMIKILILVKMTMTVLLRQNNLSLPG